MIPRNFPAIEHFASSGNYRARGNLRDGFRGIVDGLKDGEQSLDGFGLAQKFDGDFRDQRQRSFRAHKQAGQIVPNGVTVQAAYTKYVAVWKNQFQRGDVIGSYTISESMRAAGIF